MNKFNTWQRKLLYDYRGVNSSEKTLHTTSSNECKFSWNSKARRKTIAKKKSLKIVFRPFRPQFSLKISK